MASVVVYSRDFDRYLDMGLAPEQFKYRFLAEGDSWMDRKLAHDRLTAQLLGPRDGCGRRIGADRQLLHVWRHHAPGG